MSLLGVARYPWLGTTVVYEDGATVAWQSFGDGAPLRAASGRYRANDALEAAQAHQDAAHEAYLDLVVFAVERCEGGP